MASPPSTEPMLPAAAVASTSDDDDIPVDISDSADTVADAPAYNEAIAAALASPPSSEVTATATASPPSNDVFASTTALYPNDVLTQLTTSSRTDAIGPGGLYAPAPTNNLFAAVAASPPVIDGYPQVPSPQRARTQWFSRRRALLVGGAVALLAGVLLIARGTGSSTKQETPAASHETATKVDVEPEAPAPAATDTNAAATDTNAAAIPPPAAPIDDSSPTRELPSQPVTNAAPITQPAPQKTTPAAKPQTIKKPTKKPVRPVKRARKPCTTLDCV